MKFVSTFTHPHVVPNMLDHLENVSAVFDYTIKFHCTSLDFIVWTNTLRNLSKYILHSTGGKKSYKKIIYDIRVSKL